MAELSRLSAEVSASELLSVLERDGAVIVQGLMPPPLLARTLDELGPYIEATSPGSDAFAGFRTTRTGALAARSAACRELIQHPLVLEAARGLLTRWCERIQLHLSQVIRIRPGQPAQPLHRDRWAWGTHLGHLEPQFNTLWALTDFTRDNGATRVAPGSTRWPEARRPEPDELCQAEMRPGSVLVYTGSVFHGGGENRSEQDRIGINLTYTLGWLRQEENQYLSCPPEIARALEPELQELLGYTLGSYALGYFTPPLPPGQGPELVGPERALGRGPEGGGQLGSQALLEGLQAEIAPASARTGTGGSGPR